jgi:YVTN family beta-propeller protein
MGMNMRQTRVMERRSALSLSISISISISLALSLALASCGDAAKQSGGSMASAARSGRIADALPPQQAQSATWTAPIELTLVPAAGAVLANGKVMFWAADSRTSFGGSGHTFSTLFDPATNTAVEHDVTETGHDMFCPGTARLPDGRLLVNGGLDSADTSLYDPVSNTWSAAATMNIPRGYDASTTLADGSVMTLGGSWSGANGGVRNAEIFTPDTGWRLLSGVPEDPYRLDGTYEGWQSDAHMALIPTSNGKVLLAGPTVNMAWIDTTGNGSSVPAGVRGDDIPAFGGPVVMYEAGKILKVGGSTWNNGTPASATAYIIDTTAGTANVTKMPSMAYPRLYSNSVVLPNGQVLVIGGQTFSQEFSDSYAVLAPELFDPQTQTFTVLPAMSIARNYHSIALLLPDGRVISAGGGLCNCSADHTDMQIMSPPYLFNTDGTAATQPVILSAPTVVGYGTSAAVLTDSPVTAFSLVRVGSTTHTVNNGQRRVSLAFTPGLNNTYQINLPSNPGILIPGQWMLFALNAQGTPSVAAIISVSNSGAPVLQNPGTQNISVGSALYLPVTATTTTAPLTFSANALPAGMSMDAASGTISGTPSAAGNSFVTIFATDGTQTVSTDFLISVSSVGTGTGLLGQYYGNMSLSGPLLQQVIEAPYFNWGTSPPAPGLPAVSYSVRWTGAIEAVSSGPTQISTVSDDGVRVWIGNVLVIDNWTDHAPTTDTAILNWVAGQHYPITVEYYQNGGGAEMQLQWLPTGAAAVAAVPAARLYAAPVLASVNVALGQLATQSSTVSGGDASHGVDGNTDGNFSDGSVTQTAGTAAADWWQVDLGAQRRIDFVQLWNRTDCCSTNLANFVLFVSNNDMSAASIDQLRADPTVTSRQVGATNALPNISIPVNGFGRFVRVQLTGQNTLSLAEAQVFGGITVYHAPIVTPISAQQNLVGGTANLAISAIDPDGNPLTFTATGLPPGTGIDAGSGTISGILSTAGNYGVTVTASNAGGLSAAASFNWTVLAPVPQVITLPAPIAASGGSVNYAPILSPGAAAQYSWDFGDGSSDSPFSSSSAVSHTFAAAGVYTVTLTIQTSDGRTTTQNFEQAIYAAGPSALALRSSNVILEPRSGAAARLWVVNQDNDSVSVFDTGSKSRLAEISVGSAPRSIALASDGSIWVTNKQSASISIISAGALAVTTTLPLPRASQPFGIVFSPLDGSAFVALEATGQILKLSSTGASTASLAVGTFPRHLSMTAAGDQLFVSRFISRPLPGEGTAAVSTSDAAGNALGGEVLAINPSTLKLLRTIVLANSTRVDTESQGRGLPNYLGAAAISPDGKSAWIPSKQDNILRGSLRDGNPLTFQNTVRSISSRIDLTANAEDLPGRVDHDNAGVASAAVFHPTGVYLFVALETNRQVAVVDAIDKHELFRYEVGLAPQGLAISADGLTLYVNNFMDRSVSVIDLLPLVGFGQTSAPTITSLASVGTEKLAANVLRGKQLFYDARDSRLARDSYMSCASCHNDAGHDGRTWDFTGQGEGLRNTIPLRGRAGMGEGFIHWSANFDEIQDFEGQIRSLAGGTGLMADADFNAGTRSQPLGDTKAGLSVDLDALAAYVTSLSTFAASPYRNADGTLSAAAQAGRTAFLKNNCASCHGGAGFTASGNGSQLKNIGTLNAAAGQRLGAPLTGIDIPTLRDVWATAPYLHDGSAATLSAAIQAHNTVTLSIADLANVAEFVREIGGEEPTPPGAFCANENGTCTVPAGTLATVSYGANASYNVKTGVNPSIACNNATFTDPLVGTVKACYYVVTGSVSTGTGTGLLGQYFATNNLTGNVVLTRTEAVYFNWAAGSPDPTVPANNFSARWTGFIEAPSSGSYQLQTNSDDGIRVWLNGVEVINNWTAHSATRNSSAAIALAAGQRYSITVEYQEFTGQAVAQLLWKTPADTAFNAVPATRLYSK